MTTCFCYTPPLHFNSVRAAKVDPTNNMEGILGKLLGVLEIKITMDHSSENKRTVQIKV